MLRQQQNSTNPKTTRVVSQNTSSVTDSFSQQTAAPRHRQKSDYKRRWWYLGLLLVASGVTGAELVGRSLVWAEDNGHRPTTPLVKPVLTNTGYRAYTPDLSRVAWFERGGPPNQLHVLDSISNKILWTRTDLPQGELALNKDGTLLFVGRNVLNASSGEWIHTAPATLASPVFWSDNGQIATWISYRVTAKQKRPLLEVWNAKQKKLTTIEFPSDSRDHHNLSISSDGRWISYTCHAQLASPARELHIVSTTGTVPIRRLLIEDMYSVPLFSPDSKKILIKSDTYPAIDVSTLHIWSTETGALLQSTTLDKDVFEIKWSQDSRMISTHASFQYSVLDANTLKDLWHSPRFMGGNLLSLGDNRRLHIIIEESTGTSPDIRINSNYWNLSKVLPRQ